MSRRGTGERDEVRSPTPIQSPNIGSMGLTNGKRKQKTESRGDVQILRKSVTPRIQGGNDLERLLSDVQYSFSSQEGKERFIVARHNPGTSQSRSFRPTLSLQVKYGVPFVATDDLPVSLLYLYLWHSWDTTDSCAETLVCTMEDH